MAAVAAVLAAEVAGLVTAAVGCTGLGLAVLSLFEQPASAKASRPEAARTLNFEIFMRDIFQTKNKKSRAKPLIFVQVAASCLAWIW
jgi:hypothetical protein